MPKLFIPSLGDQLLLTRSWTFPLYYEYRNIKLGHALEVPHPTNSDGTPYVGVARDWPYRPPTHNPSTEVTLPKGTILRLDRIYIRSGSAQADYSSLSFWADLLPDPKSTRKSRRKGGKARFWAKLSDCNRIMFKLIEEG